MTPHLRVSMLRIRFVLMVNARWAERYVVRPKYESKVIRLVFPLVLHLLHLFFYDFFLVDTRHLFLILICQFGMVFEVVCFPYYSYSTH